MDNSRDKKRKATHAMYYAGIGLVVVAVVIAIIFLLQGETKTYGEFPDPEKSASLNCEVVGYSYPFFTYDNARKRTTEINAILDGDILKKITLTYTLSYDDAGVITKSEAENHAAMNKQFAEDKLGHDLFGSSYAKLNDGLKYTITTDADGIYNHGGAKYFLIEGAGDAPYSGETMKRVYQQKGFKCEQK